MNKVERHTANTDHAIRSLIRQHEQHNLRNRDTLIDLWMRTAQNSPSEHVRNSIPLIRHVAATVAALNQVGVTELTLCNAHNDMVIVGDASFQRNPHEVLPGIVTLATSSTPITELEAWGSTTDDDEVISIEQSQHRCIFVYSLVDILLGTWTHSVHTIQSQEQRKDIFENMSVAFSWITTWEKQNIENRLRSISSSSVDIKAVVSELSLNANAQDVPFLNIFVIGMRGTGKSTTRWLMTGRGREDVSETSENTTRSVTAVTDLTGRRLLVWDTPGLNEGYEVDRYYLMRIKAEMMGVSHISAVMLQVTNSGRQTSQEKDMLKEYNVWFGGTLSSNLMIVFKAKVSNRFRDKYIEEWERTLQEIGVGRIGAENYVFFSANTAEDDDESIVLTNDAEVSRVAARIEGKQLCVVEANRVAARALLESEAVKEGERRQKLKRLLNAQNREETDAFREVIRLGRRVDTKYRPGQLHVTVAKYERAQKLVHYLSFGLYKRMAITKFIIQATCPRTKHFLEMMDKELPSVRRGQSEYWIERFFDEQYGMQLMSLTKVSMLENRVLHLFAEGIPADETTIEKVVQLLGRRKALDILESVHDKSERFESIQKMVDNLSVSRHSPSGPDFQTKSRSTSSDMKQLHQSVA